LIDKEYVIEKMQKELSKKINTNKFIIWLNIMEWI
jgi:hypothetical protein